VRLTLVSSFPPPTNNIRQQLDDEGTHQPIVVTPNRPGGQNECYSRLAARREGRSPAPNKDDYWRIASRKLFMEAKVVVRRLS
jgi:hypothetical protein